MEGQFLATHSYDKLEKNILDEEMGGVRQTYIVCSEVKVWEKSGDMQKGRKAIWN